MIYEVFPINKSDTADMFVLSGFPLAYALRWQEQREFYTLAVNEAEVQPIVGKWESQEGGIGDFYLFIHSIFP